MSRHTSLGRKRLRQFLLAVVAVHAVAIAAYYAFDVQHAAARVQRAYAWIWMGITVGVVLVGLQRIKRARGRPVPSPPRDETPRASD